MKDLGNEKAGYVQETAGGEMWRSTGNNIKSEKTELDYSIGISEHHAWKSAKSCTKMRKTNIVPPSGKDI